jgi:hypothetical protein
VKLTKNNTILMFLYTLFIIIGCNKSSPSESTFVPPKDKMVTKEMAKRYAVVSVALTKAVEEEAIIIEEFREKYNISLDMKELADREFREKHPEIIKDWEKIQKDWQSKQNAVYEKYGMNEEEWDWIANSLIMPRNRPMQEFIRNEIDRIEKEGLQQQTQTRDNK